MFGIGPMEIAIIVIFALVFVGPKKLPELAQQFGRFFVQMKRMTSDVRSTFDDYVKKAEQELLQEDREKLRKLLSKDLLNPLKTIDTQLKNEVNQALSSNHDSHHHDHQNDHDQHHNSTDDVTPDGAKDAPRPSGSTPAGWEKT